MRLNSQKVKESILHPVPEVREAAAHYFADAYDPDAAVMPLVIRAIEKYGFDKAFTHYGFLEDLVQTEETFGWLMQQIKRKDRTKSDDEAKLIWGCLGALTSADLAILKRHRDEIDALGLPRDYTDLISERFRRLHRTADELWEELEEFCESYGGDEPDEDVEFGDGIVEALARKGGEVADRLLAVLRCELDDSSDFMEGLAVRLAGAMKLETALPFLIERLHAAEDDWFIDECHEALIRLGGDAVVTQLVEDYPDGEVDFRTSVAYVLQDIHSDLSVQTCLELLEEEDDEGIRQTLLQSLLLNFATGGLEPARQLILETPFDLDVLELRATLLTVCQMMGLRFPEFDAWLKDSGNDAAFRNRWYEEHPSDDDEEEERSEDDDDADWNLPDEFDDYMGETEADESIEDEQVDGFGPPPGPSTIVRDQPTVGRNDPCPCGSGKKFKKCCYRANNQ